MRPASPYRASPRDAGDSRCSKPEALRSPPNARVAVVIPCYRVTQTVLGVICAIGPEVDTIICVDDGCPDGSGDVIEGAGLHDNRVRVVRHDVNRGVGAAMCTGYREALRAGADVVVKIDGDGQMNPKLIPNFVAPIVSGEADYVKGNRFFDIETVRSMPRVRLFGNAVLSFFSKISSGYWDLFDPTNGYTAIAARVAAQLPLDKLHPRFFFESDILFRLNTLRSRVIELPLVAAYGAEKSNLSELHSSATFPALHLRNAAKRIVYSYFLRGFSIASVNLVVGSLLLLFGIAFGIERWISTREMGFAATPGTVMLAALPVMIGLQLLLSFLAHDMSTVPTTAIHPKLHRVTVLGVPAHPESEE